MSSASLQLRSAIITLLRADVTLQSSVGQRVYNYITEDLPYPYLLYYEATVNQEDTDEIYGKEHMVQIHCFDDYEGQARIDSILDRVSRLLRSPSLVLAAHWVVNSHLMRTDVVLEDQLHHGIASFRIVTEEK